MRSLIDMSKKYPLTERDLGRMNLGEKFWHCTLDAIPEQCGYKQSIKTWIEKMPEMLAQGMGMVLTGEWRQGKTSAAVVCAKATVTHGGTAYLIRADQVAGVVVNSDRFDDDSTVEQRCMNVDLLVIDDLVQGGGYEQAKAMMERLIRYRYDHRKSMIVTTNTGLDGIEKRYGQGTAMVLRSRCLPVKVEGTNFYEHEKAEVDSAFSPPPHPAER